MDYIYRHTKPKPLPAPKPKKILTPGGERLSVILENNNNNSLVHPAHRTNRLASLSSISLGRRSHNGPPPGAGAEKPPPRYSSIYEEIGNSDGLDGEGLPGLKGRLQRRGGWKRVIAFFVALIVIIAIALGVGLGVGLRKSSSSGSAVPTQTPNPFSPPQAYPLGLYSITTNLKSSSTDCSSNDATWTCDSDPVVWVISNSTGSTKRSSRSSSQGLEIFSNNPFQAFGPAPLSLRAMNTPTEHYHFSVNLARPVAPTTSLDASSPNREICYFNSTIFSGNLYTRMARTVPNFSNSTKGSDVSGGLWPFAVEFSYVAVGGANVPNCYIVQNGALGSRIGGLVPQSSDQQCQCRYQNF